MAMILSSEDSADAAQWRSKAASALARSYGEDEPENSAADIKAERPS
jgi:hypothetical protein